MSTAHQTKSHQQKTLTNFTYDLDRMKKAVQAPSHKMPDNLGFEEFIQWVNQKAKK